MCCRSRSRFLCGTMVHATCILAFVLVPLVDSRLFTYEGTNEHPCKILLELDFSATITAKDQKTAVVAETVETAVNMTETGGSCVNYTNTISIGTDGVTFLFTFTTGSLSDNGSVELLPQMDVQASVLFPDVEKESGYVCFQGSSETLGKPTVSYLCAREEKPEFNVSACEAELPPLKSKLSYSVEFVMENIQAQAYNVKEDAFSAHVNCETPQKSYMTGLIVGILVGMLLLVAITVVVVALVIRRKRNSVTSQQNNVQDAAVDETSSLLGSS